MPRFIKIDEADVDAKNIVLGIMRADDGTIVGRLVAMTVSHAGLTPTTTAPDDPPIAEAVQTAVTMAASAECDVSVIDPDDLWQPSWGELHVTSQHAK